jgi:hypothetical protein
MVLATITLKVKDGVKDGYYALPFDAKGDNGAMANRIVEEGGERKPIILNPTYLGAVVTVGNPGETTASPSPSPATSPSPAASPSPSPSASNTPNEDPAGDTIKIEAGEVSGKPGDKVKLTITAKDVGAGFSALQFDYDLDKSFEITRGIKGDFDGSWTIGKTERSAQFLEQDGVNISGDGVIGKLEIQIPADAKGGEYEFKFTAFEGSMVDTATNKQVSLDNKKFTGVAGKIIVDGPTDETSPSPAESPSPAASPSPSATVGDGIQIEIGEVSGNAGDKVKVPVYAKNIGNGFSALQFDYDLDKSFEITRGIKGDFDCSWTIGKSERSVQFLEQDGMNITADGLIGKLEIQIPKDAKDGVYEIKLSNFEGAMVDPATGKQVSLTNDAFVGVAGKITVGTTPSPSPEAGEDDAYDVNGDGVVNTADIIALKKYLLLVKDAKVVNGDINKDGSINSMDMVRLVNKLLK